MRLLLIGLLSMLAAAVHAQALDDPDIDVGALEERRLESLEQASGFIIDRTITNFGGEFVRVFSQAWRSLPGTGELDVTVVERPTARYGSMVWVEHNQRPIARAFLYAGRTAAIRPIAIATAEYVAQKLADDALANQLFEDPDLAKQGL
jgi:curli production assembly/transport component CsgE